MLLLLLLLLRCSRRLILGILVVILRVLVVLPVGLVWVLVREDVLHVHFGAVMQPPPQRFLVEEIRLCCLSQCGCKEELALRLKTMRLRGGQ